MNNSMADQGMIDEAIAALTQAMKDLKEETLVTDKATLKAILEQAKAIRATEGHEFTPSTKAQLDQSIEVGETVLADDNARQEQIDAAEKAVRTALDGLEEQALKVDKGPLSELIQKAESAEPTTGYQFTKKTQDALTGAIEQAKAVVNNEAATQEEVEQSVAALTQALEALEEETKPVGNGGTGSVTTKPDTTGKLPKANEAAAPVWGISGLLLVLGVVLGKLFLKNKKQQD